MKRRVTFFAVVAVLIAGGFVVRDDMIRRISDYLIPLQEEPVPTMKVRKANYRILVPAKGELSGFSTRPVQTPRVRTGSLKIAWLVGEGSLVREGDPVVRFDETDALLTLEQSRTKFDSFRSQLSKTKETAEGELRILDLEQEAAEMELAYAQGQVRRDEEIFSRWEIQESLMSAALASYKKEVFQDKETLQKDISSSEIQILDIETRKVDSEIEMVRETLASLTMEAPQQGVVLYRRFRFDLLEVGAEVWPGQTLLDIASLDQFLAEVQIPEKDIAGVSRDCPVDVALEAFPGRIFSGRIDQIARVAKQIDRENPLKYFECKISLEVPLELMQEMKPGMIVAANIEIASGKDSIIVPKNAVTRNDGSFSVFVKEGEEFQEVDVEILSSDHGFYVLDGLEAGSEVCLEHPFRKQELYLPDLNAPSAGTQQRRFVVFF